MCGGVLTGEAGVQGLAVLVEPDDFGVDAAGSELGDDCVQGGNRRAVPDVGVGGVDDHVGHRVGVVESVDKLVGRGEEQLAGNRVQPLDAVGSTTLVTSTRCATRRAKKIAASSTPATTPYAS